MTPDTRAQLGDQGPAGGSGPRELLPYRSAQGRWVLAAMILGTSVTGIDSTVVVVALPTIGRNLHVGFQGLQWTVTADTQALIQTPVPHLICLVAFPKAPEQTRPDSTQASGRSFAADAPSPSRPG